MLLGTAKMTRPARTAIRFPLKASVTFFWQDDAGETHDGRGQSRDISEHGLFVFSEMCPPLGSRVLLRILIEEPPEVARTLRMQVNGHVLRVDQPTSEARMCGFAILTGEAMLKENDDPVN
jgi:hypothetical protein